MDKPLDAPGLAELLGVSLSWVHKKCAARAIPHCRVARQIRFAEEHVRAILAAGEQPLISVPAGRGAQSRRRSVAKTA
jgi:hypothetical protein